MVEVSVHRRYRFSASHRLHIASLDEVRNRQLYGKCNNPFGHGHDYVLDVGVAGNVNETSGKMFALRALDDYVERMILRDFSNRNLNLDCPEFEALVPTTENIAAVIAARLQSQWHQAMPACVELTRVFIQETDRNSFEILLGRPAEMQRNGQVAERPEVHA